MGLQLGFKEGLGLEVMGHLSQKKFEMANWFTKKSIGFVMQRGFPGSAEAGLGFFG